MDGLTEGPMDQPTKRGVESRSTPLKIKFSFSMPPLKKTSGLKY